MPTSTVPQRYPPSWFDRYLAWVDRLPIPLWLYYILLYVFSVALTHFQLVITGIASFGQIEFVNLIAGFWLVFESGTIHYLDYTGRRQMEKFKPLIASSKAYEDLHYRIQSMPARSVNIVTALLFIVIFLVALIDPGVFAAQGASSLIIALSAFTFVVAYITTPVYLFHIYHQLKVVRQAYTHVSEISLFELGSLHSLAPITAATGNALFLLLILNLVNNVLLSVSEAVFTTSFAISGIFITVAILVFIFPLKDIRSRIKAAKGLALAQNGSTIQQTIKEQQSRLQQLNYSDSTEMESAISALFKVRNEIKKISPWPWQPDTLRNFLSAILLPVFLILIQQLLSRFF